MSEPIGVQAGRVCPGCGWEDSVPLLWGLPDPEAMRLAERGQVALGGCLVMGEDPAFACRSCGLQWGREEEPTADEQELADLLGVRHLDVVRALGAGWRRESVPDETGHRQWFLSGAPAQVALGVEGPWFVLARPLTRWAEPLQLQPADRQPFTRDDLLYLPEVVAEAADEIAARRRRSFRWCRTCRRVQSPEWFTGAARSCRRCEAAVDRFDADVMRLGHS
ncbi:hypothetical protein [Blastococcus sp. TF02A-30]|uniref:hypothetical protein n=1 Tax=Blastococcus sp. TF02A-30 TaxID=2250580 RepID=UPI000DEAE277|nr:hypothetical protein [Blastococcus sp. TF02A-30]RBY91054.1 hypothetical protein DQ241_05110 [Blastococcus sp. TF02A-30]